MSEDKIITDNPLMDEIVYNCKTMILSCILKDQDEADKYETLDSIKQADLYMAIIEGRALFNMFTYDRNILATSSLPSYLIDECVLDNSKIPDSIKPEVLKTVSTKFINEYVETNNYYRMIGGLPDVGDDGLLINSSLIPDSIKNLININMYIHNMNSAQLELLANNGVISKLLELYPTKKYLKYLLIKINSYYARKASKFDLLYLPEPPSISVYANFKTKFELNKTFILKTVYSEAYKFQSPYYDKIIMILILLQTMTDMVVQLPEYIIRKDIFDLRTIQYLFEGFGVEFFPEIPIKYQIAMVRNLNKLIKFKSTTANIIDICSLFGFEDIQVFKYYLLRERQIDNDGNHINYTKQIKNPDNPDETINVADNDKNFELKFIKVPIKDIADDYIKNNINLIPYDELTLDDEYWDGDETHESVKSKIINEEFNYERSKYISIDTVYRITELTFEMPYFFNMIFDTTNSKELLSINIPFISNSINFKFTDVFVYLYSLMYEYNGIEDSIMDTTGKVLYVKGFNFKANLSALETYIESKGYTLKDLGCSDFQIPSGNILSYNQLLNIFTKNKEVYTHVINQLITCDNKQIYDIYKKIYDSLMVTKLNLDYYKLNDGTIATTYTEYLQNKSPYLYNSLKEIKNIKELETKRKIISDNISNTVYALEEYFDSDKFEYIYSNLPGVSADAIKQYMYKVINFFKSYNIELLDIKTIYRFDDKLENRVQIIDSIIMNHIYEKSEIINMIEKVYNNISINPKDNVNILDKVYIDISRWVERKIDVNIFEKNDNIGNLNISLFKFDKANITDSATIRYF